MKSAFPTAALCLAILMSTAQTVAAQTQSEADKLVSDTMAACMEWIKAGSTERLDADWGVSEQLASSRELLQSLHESVYFHSRYSIHLQASQSPELGIRECNLVGMGDFVPPDMGSVNLDSDTLKEAFARWYEEEGQAMGLKTWAESEASLNNPPFTRSLVALHGCDDQRVMEIEGFEILDTPEPLMQDWQIQVRGYDSKLAGTSERGMKFYRDARSVHCTYTVSALR